jgi:hypothetical protein
MTRTVEFSPKLEAQLERAAAQLQTDVPSYIQDAVKEKTARVFDEARFETLLQSDALGALDYLIQTTPDNRLVAGFSPSPPNDVALSYEDKAE